jgi:hypothetical protein
LVCFDFAWGRYDIPFACLYLLDAELSGGRLSNVTGYARDAHLFPETVVLVDEEMSTSSSSDSSGGEGGDGDGDSDNEDEDKEERERDDDDEHVRTRDRERRRRRRKQQSDLTEEFRRLFREVAETRQSRQLDLTPYEEVQPCGGWNERPRYTFLFYLFVIKMIVPFIFTITV